MLLDIKKYGSEVLRKKSIDVKDITKEILQLMDDMVETLHDIEGVGLAAPQVGVNLRIFIIDIGDGKVRKVINPMIEYSDDKIECEEGCLSIPGVYKNVQRSAKVTVKYMNENGEQVEETGSELLGRAFQHEYDHLEGILFTDKLSPVAKRLVKKRLQEISKAKGEPAL
ncbi:MAG: peptide deformylase [Fusobacteriaceae bacterium]